MDAKERSEKIYKVLLIPETSTVWIDPVIFIAAQISEAEREARESVDELFVLNVDCEFGKDCLGKGCSGASHYWTYKQIWNAAREKASLHVRAANAEDAHWEIADRIAKMEPYK